MVECEERSLLTPDAPAGRKWPAVDPGQALRQVLAAVTAGSIGGLLTLSAAIAYPAVIFTGSLAEHLGLGITAALLTAMVLGAVVACLSTCPAAIAQAQIETAVVLGAVAAVITETLQRAPEGVQLATLLAVIAVATASLGLCFVVLGAFRLGNVVRYIPFPVIFGFLGYIAWLLAKGGFAIMVGRDLDLQTASLLLHPEALGRWLPPVRLALGLLALQLRRRHLLNLPAALLLALAGFWLIAWLGGATPAAPLDGGHVLEPLAPGPGWSPWRLPAALASVEWSVVRAALPQIAIVSFVATITLLLTASTLEVATRPPVDLNRELTVTGMGNLLAALGGGLPGYHSLSASLLPHYLGTRSRPVGLIGALFCVGMLLFGGSLLAFVPKLLIGLVLLYLAFDIAAELILERWPLIGPGEKAVALLVLAALVGIGFVEGILIGCAGGLVVFAINYARTGVVRAAGSGLAYASHVVRPADQMALLEALGAAIHVVRLQGFLFFGTAHRLLDEIGGELAALRAVPLRYLLLDFSRVIGADASAITTFMRLSGEAESRGFRIVLAAVPAAVAGLIKTARGGAELPIFPDLDHCLEHAENALLAAAVPPDGLTGGGAADQLEAVLDDPLLRRRLLAYARPVTWQPGETVMVQGERSDGLYILEAGRLTARPALAQGGTVRVTTLLPDTLFGEIGCYLSLPRTLTLTAESTAAAWVLDRDALDRMRAAEPDLAADFHYRMVQVTASRLASLTRHAAHHDR